MKRLVGKITESGDSVVTQDGTQFKLPFRATGRDGYPEVLIDAQRVGGDSCFRRQSITKWIGHEVEFLTGDGETGFNFEILPITAGRE
jgi:hypothetical protein